VTENPRRSVFPLANDQCTLAWFDLGYADSPQTFQSRGKLTTRFQARYLLAFGWIPGLFNINICRNNTEDVRKLTEYAHDHRVATDYHINETPMLEQDDHFKHLYDNPTYIRPEDWREVDALVDWLIEKNKSG
jgi:hypothetical protein